MGWVAGPRLVSATAEAGALGILASATMTFDQLASAIREVRSRTDRPFGVNLRADAEDADARVALLVRERVPVASFALAPREQPDQTAEGRRHRRGALDRSPSPRREGRRVGRRRRDRAGRRGRRPHRVRRHDLAAPPSGRRGRHPGDRGGWVLRRPGSRRRARVRRVRYRDGNAIPPDKREHRARFGEAVLPRAHRCRHGRDDTNRRCPPPRAAHRLRRRARSDKLDHVVAARAAQRSRVPEDVGHLVARDRCERASRCGARPT